MEQFTASNGIVVRGSDTGVYMDKVEAGIRLFPADVDALREFFQHERDEELGRWRWPDNPEWIAVEGDRMPDGRTVVVVNERTLDRFWFNEHVRATDATSSPAHHAGNAYFEAHSEPEPERKPWEDAKEGDVWVISFGGNEYPAIFQAGELRDHGGHWIAESINDARRIWPVSDD